MNRNATIVVKLALVAYFFVAGAILLSSPWSSIWPHSSSLAPWLLTFFSSSLVKGFFSGFGLVMLAAAVFEIRNAIQSEK